MMIQKMPKNHLFRIFFPVLYGSVLYVLILLVFENFEAAFKSFFSNEWLFTILLTYLSSELLHFVTVIISKRLTFAGKIAKYLLIQIFATAVATFLLVYLAIHIYFTWIEGTSVYNTELTVFELFYLFSVLLYNLFVFSYLLLNEDNTLQSEQENEFKRRNEILIRSIRNDVDEEVLYASMESLLVYIQKDENISADIINRLSWLYRYRLENKYTELISVEKEMEALENLVHLFNYIYSGSIDFKFSGLYNCNDYFIIPMWLQKIVLTVIRCNIISPVDKFKILLDYQDKSLILRHNWREKLLVPEKDEIEKISRDFEFYTSRKIEIMQSDELITLVVPLFRNESETL